MHSTLGLANSIKDCIVTCVFSVENGLTVISRANDEVNQIELTVEISFYR